MTYQEVIDHFGSGYKVAKAGGFSAGAPYGWKKLGYVPIHSQRRLEQITKGALKASLDHCPAPEVR